MWIPLSERKPTSEDCDLYLYGDGFMFHCVWLTNGDEVWTGRIDDTFYLDAEPPKGARPATHWMPIKKPEPPKD